MDAKISFSELVLRLCGAGAAAGAETAGEGGNEFELTGRSK